MSLMGGKALFLGPSDIQLGVNESMKDTAKVESLPASQADMHAVLFGSFLTHDSRGQWTQRAFLSVLLIVTFRLGPGVV